MNFLNRVRRGLFSSAEKIFADHQFLFDRYHSIRDLLDLSFLRGMFNRLFVVK